MKKVLSFNFLPLISFTYFSHIESFRSPCFSSFICGVFMFVIMVWFYNRKVIYDRVYYKTYDRYGYLGIFIFLFLVKLKNYFQITFILKTFCLSPFFCISLFLCLLAGIYIKCWFCVQHCPRCSFPRCI